MSIALAAVVGLAFLGKTISDNDELSLTPVHTSELLPGTTKQERANSKPSDEFGFQDLAIHRLPRHRQEVNNFGDISKDAGRSVFGQPVYNLEDRQNVSNKMNNVNPNPWTRVGPGLGVPANVPAYGGYQQLLRVLPTNTNEYKLVQLPGRAQAPAASLVPGGESRIRMDKNRPEKDYHHTPNKASAIQTAPELRPKFIKGSRWTKKDVSHFVADGLEKGAPRYILQSGYIVSGNQQLDRSDRRAKGSRSGNPGNMNVRADPLNAHGMLTTVRVDSYGNKAPPVGSFMVPSNYYRTGMQEANPYKENINNRSLDVAKKQLAGNPYNHPIN